MHFYSEKAIRITYSECVSIALGTQHAIRMRHTVVCAPPRSTIFLHIISQTARLKKLLNKNMCFDFLYNFCLKLFSFLEEFGEMWFKMSVGLTVKYRKVPLLCPILMKLEFLERFSKNSQISNFMKIRPVGEEFFHTDGRTDRHDDANSRSPEFCERT